MTPRLPLSQRAAIVVQAVERLRDEPHTLRPQSMYWRTLEAAGSLLADTPADGMPDWRALEILTGKRTR